MSGKVFVVAKSRLSALPVEKQKVNAPNGPTDVSKKSNPKTKGSSNSKTENSVEDSFEILEEVLGASLVGKK